jgi:hypothetical protein
MRRLFFGLLMLLSVTATSRADVITFDGLPGPTSAPFPSPYTEAGFTVTSSGGDWFQGLRFGNPTPSIFSDSDLAAIDVARIGGGTFTFSQVDLADANNLDPDGPDYLFEGFRNGNLLFSHPGGPIPIGFVTVDNPSSGVVIDLLRITLTRVDTTDYNLDNINVTPAAPIPEPATLIVFGGLAVLGVAGYRCRRGIA